ncbi:MAG: 30S ribosome-binding factor RbfA [Deltaproteobacteria bacterium]|jgi:ribosome-binding factor A|nr:30S ribosome-binding factor RbfA [Deltaproteobacteria bacterium]
MSRQRLERMNSLISSTVNELILTKSKDPRLRGVTVTRAIISGNLQTARIFYSLLDSGRLDEARTALEKASGFVRSYLAANLDLKYAPKVIFEHDRNLEYAQHVGQILGQLGLMDQAAPSDSLGGEDDAGEGGLP